MTVYRFVFITMHLNNIPTYEASLQPSLYSRVMCGHSHVTCGLVMTDSARLTSNTMLSHNHEVVKQKNLVKMDLNFLLTTVKVRLLGYSFKEAKTHWCTYYYLSPSLMHLSFTLSST